MERAPQQDADVGALVARFAAKDPSLRVRLVSRYSNRWKGMRESCSVIAELEPRIRDQQSRAGVRSLASRQLRS
jgi:hypothetical protein